MARTTFHNDNTDPERVRIWLDTLRGNDSLRDVAAKVDSNGATLSTARTTGKINPHLVIQIAKTYGQNPIQGLIETGYLTPEDAQQAQNNLPTSPRDFTSTELLQELLRREQAGTSQPEEPQDEFTRRRLQVEALTETEIIELGAARHTPIEPQLGEDGYHDGP